MSVFEKSFGTKKVNNTSFGRKELVAPYEENDLTPEVVGLILEGVLPTHINNVQEKIGRAHV